MGETGGLGLSSLLCLESESCMNEHEEEDENARVRSDYDPCFVFSKEEDDGYLRELVQRERLWFGSEPKTPLSCIDCTAAGGGWIRSARLDAVHWILRTRALFGFQHHTAYLSIAYFDRFLSIRSLDEGKSWAIRLLSVACLSIAVKMEEFRVPPLSEFPVEDYVFEAKVIRKMELLVLSTLDWKMGLITPFAYLHYFVNKFFHGVESIPKGLISRVAESLLDITKEISLMVHRPSVLAAAAVLAASNGKLTTKDLQLRIGEISSWVSQENECVFFCYNLMQKIEMGKHRTPESVIFQGNRDENSSCSSGNETKRRLSFDHSDQFSPAKKIHRS